MDTIEAALVASESGRATWLSLSNVGVRLSSEAGSLPLAVRAPLAKAVTRAEFPEGQIFLLLRHALLVDVCHCSELESPPREPVHVARLSADELVAAARWYIVATQIDDEVRIAFEDELVFALATADFRRAASCLVALEARKQTVDAVGTRMLTQAREHLQRVANCRSLQAVTSELALAGSA